MNRDRGWNGSTRRRWVIIAWAAALAALWVAVGYGGGMPNAPVGYDALAVPALQAAAGPGEATYGQYCAACHQVTGKGLAGTFPPLTGPVTNGDPHFLARIVLYGLAGRTVVLGQSYNIAMAGLAGRMTDAQIAQVLTYVRSSWGNTASAVTEDVIKDERAKPGTAQDNYANYPK